MAFGLQNIGLPAAEIAARVASAAKTLEIGELLERRPAQLSGGQRQRVAIGRAIVKDPKAFLFDEPLSNLDAALRVRTRVELAELHQRLRATMIYVTHDQIEAMTLADRIVVLNDRRIEQIGTPMDVYSKPATRFVAGFVGSPAMNFTKVEVQSRSKNEASVRLPDGSIFSAGIDLSGASGQGHTLGIRADAVNVVGPDGGSTNAEAQVVERLGERTLVHVHLSDGSALVAQDKGASTVKAGDKVGLKFDGREAHIFDDTGKAFHADT
jgi:multiple sugar transport system ATP-binding protein